MQKKCFLILFFLTQFLFGQSIQQAEYFWDTDPGSGNGFALTASDGNFGSALEVVLSQNANLPSSGDHVLYVRVKGDNGIWGPTFRKVFRIASNTNTNLEVKLSQAEYFWDTDPGEGNASTLLAFDGNFSQAFESVFSNSSVLPTVGDHILHVRVKSQDGFWSPTFKKVFRLTSNNNTNLGAKLSQAEYFWDTDPGNGNGITLLAFDGNFNQALETVLDNNANLPSVGDHVLHVRVKGLDNNWSPTFKKVFRLTTNNNTNLAVKLSQAEYFWDTDPGVGNGLALLAFDGNFNQALESILTNNATLPQEGDHVLNIRVKAQDGIWSPTFSRVFRLSPNNNTNFEVKLSQAEYFWDTDPGVGNGLTLLAFDGNFNQALESVFTNNATLPQEGDHVLNIRVKALDGNWGPTFGRVFRLSTNNNTNQAARITQSEFFWDTDPGVGNGNVLLAFDGNFDEALEMVSNSIDVTINSGLHILNVRTKTDDGNWGPTYRKVVGVNVAFDQKVILQSPENNSVNVSQSPTLVWNQLNQLQNYEFEVSLSPSFETFIASGFTTALTFVSLENLAPNTIYYWRVRANVNGEVSLWSDVWQFTTNANLQINESELLKQIIIHPNPVTTNLFVQHENSLGPLQYQIFDISGRKILEGDLESKGIDVRRLSEGTYIISLRTKRQSKFSTQFIKVN